MGFSDRGLDPVIDRIRQEACRYLPALAGRRVRRVDVCFRPMAVGERRLLIQGQDDHARVVAITGQEGDGITFAPALANRALAMLPLG
jgi:glycine/D-amino acid oxidase-like deaminating enzyme